MDEAKKFYEWALTPHAQTLAAPNGSFQIPSNPATPVPPEAPDLSKVKLIAYDFATYGCIGHAHPVAGALGQRSEERSRSNSAAARVPRSLAGVGWASRLGRRLLRCCHGTGWSEHRHRR